MVYILGNVIKYVLWEKCLCNFLFIINDGNMCIIFIDIMLFFVFICLFLNLI